MYSKKEIIVIVDAFSNGVNYAAIFFGMGFQCIHVHSNYEHFKQHLPWGKDLFFIKEFFIDDLILKDNNIEELINKIKHYKVKAVIAGAEPGVNLADQISNHFDVLKNDVTTTESRRNKFLMIEALKNKGIPCAKQFCSNKLEEFINWYRSSGFKKVVLKPTLSSTSDGVIICTSADQITEAFTTIFNKTNYIGFQNEEVVMQEYMEGPEYIVNAVSCQGKHFVTDMWQGKGGIENTISTDEYCEMLDKNFSEYHVLKNYNEQVLDALSIQNGPSHAEIKYTASGPKLIEVGARLAGLFDFSIVQKYQGYSQLSVAVETYLNPELFPERIAIYEKLPQTELMRFVYFHSDISGLINIEPNLDKFFKLDSIESIKFLLKTGDYLDITNKTIGRPGYASMLSTNKEDLERDYSNFRSLEKEFYNQITKKI